MRETNNNNNLVLMEETRRFAHDLRAPVMALQSLLATAQRTNSGAEVKELKRPQADQKWAGFDQELLSKSTQRLLNMSLDYLDFCKKELRRSKALPKQTTEAAVEELQELNVLDFRKVLKEAVQEIKFQDRNASIGFTLRDFLSLQATLMPGGSSRKTQLLSNANELRRVLSNLLQNAAEACEDYSTASVIVSAYVDEGHLQVEIQDNGEGMCPDTLRHAFEGKSFRPHGNGLGLSHAQRILKSWKAKMQIDSRIGKGTTVMLSFPLHSAQ